MSDVEVLRNSNLVPITYEKIREAMKNSPYKMNLTSKDFTHFAEAVNQGIDSRLQACFSPDRGDKFQQVSNKARITISVESLPVLIRRLLESEKEEANLLGESILTSLGFKDNGKWVDPEE